MLLMGKNSLQGGAPPVISWFIIPSNYRYDPLINPSEIGLMFTNLANYGAPPCMVFLWFSYGFPTCSASWICCAKALISAASCWQVWDIGAPPRQHRQPVSTNEKKNGCWGYIDICIYIYLYISIYIYIYIDR